MDIKEEIKKTIRSKTENSDLMLICEKERAALFVCSNQPHLTGIQDITKKEIDEIIEFLNEAKKHLTT